MTKLQLSSYYGEFKPKQKGAPTKMKDLTNLTESEANKLECALIMLEGEIRTVIRNYERIAEDDSLPDKSRETFKGNAEWWREVYEMIYETTSDPSERNWKGEDDERI